LSNRARDQIDERFEVGLHAAALSSIWLSAGRRFKSIRRQRVNRRTELKELVEGLTADLVIANRRRRRGGGSLSPGAKLCRGDPSQGDIAFAGRLLLGRLQRDGKLARVERGIEGRCRIGGTRLMTMSRDPDGQHETQSG
jgi:hypothetical protein